MDSNARWEPLPPGHNTGRMGKYEIQVGIDSGNVYLFDIHRKRRCHTLQLAEHGYAICRRTPASPAPEGVTPDVVAAIERIVDHMSRDTRAMVEDEIAAVYAWLKETTDGN